MNRTLDYAVISQMFSTSSHSRKTRIRGIVSWIVIKISKWMIVSICVSIEIQVPSDAHATVITLITAILNTILRVTKVSRN